MRLKIRKVAQSSLGLTLPQTLLSELGWAEGHELYVLRTPNGIELSRLDPDFEEALESSRQGIARNPNAMRRFEQE